MEILIPILKVVHVINAILMAWPFYALVAVNQRARLGPPLGDRADTLIENTIKNRVVPCYVFQATALISGLALILLLGLGLHALVTNWVLGAKFLLLLIIAALLYVVHLNIQPRLDALFAASSGGKISDADAAQIRRLRLTRKRLSSVCLFCVLTISMLGVQSFAPFPIWLTVALVIFLAAFTWRAYNSLTPYGWV